MKQALWRAAIFLLVLIGAGFTLAALVAPRTAGTFGVALQPDTARAWFFQITKVTPDSQAQREGITVGDLAEIHFPNTITCALAAAGTHCDLRLWHGARRKNIDLVALPGDTLPWWEIALQVVLGIPFLFMAALLAWRRPDDSAARALAGFFGCFGCAGSINALYLANPLVLFFASVLIESLFIIGGAFVVRFAAIFPQASNGDLRALLRRITPYVAGIGITSGALRLWYQTFHGTLERAFLGVLGAIWIYFVLATVTALTISLVRATGADRLRMRWIAWTFAVGYSGLLVGFIALALGNLSLINGPVAVTVVAIPFGLGYVILRHRVLDIGFVLNRALVYAGVSIVVVGTFVLLEWFVGKYVEDHSHLTAGILQLLVALGLGFSMRYIHNRIDSAVDDIFFRTRHQAESAIRRFAHESVMVTERTALLVKTLEVVLQNTGTSAAAIYLRRDGQYEAVQTTFDCAESVSENDWALLSMRTWHEPVDLIQGKSQLPGELAFPMTVRGRLLGCLVCGSKATDETYAPDERDALRVLAHDVGLALDALGILTLRREVGKILDDPGTLDASRSELRRLATSGGSEAF
ncbi:MAG: GAF domain-containing protein [Candidatus Eremiobacteraeota bacterium]|nr:GAF domain-containing protein [Candidatus Eremiobacteraeota bacterium]